MRTHDFGTAIHHLKAGGRVAREGWNGEGMWLSLTPGRTVQARGFWSANNMAFAKDQPTGEARVRPYITTKTVDDEIVPWVASQTDVLAEDWTLLEDL